MTQAVRRSDHGGASTNQRPPWYRDCWGSGPSFETAQFFRLWYLYVENHVEKKWQLKIGVKLVLWRILYLLYKPIGAAPYRFWCVFWCYLSNRGLRMGGDLRVWHVDPSQATQECRVTDRQISKK